MTVINASKVGTPSCARRCLPLSESEIEREKGQKESNIAERATAEFPHSDFSLDFVLGRFTVDISLLYPVSDLIVFLHSLLSVSDSGWGEARKG